MRYKNGCFKVFLMFLLIGVYSIITVSCNRSIDERRVQKNVYIEGRNMKGLSQSEVRKRIEELALKTDTQAKAAKLDDKKWIVIQNESSGKRVNVDSTVNAVMNAAESASVSLQIEEVAPGVTSQQLKDNIVEIGSFTTPILDKQENRLNNILIAARKIDLTKLAPGEEFSFNGVVGKRTEAKGYEEAPVIIKTEDGYEKGIGVGGGICQISTTIYNAVEKAAIEVTERHVHAKNIGYVPPGKDAAVSYGTVDFKFRNTRQYPVMLRVYVEKNSLTVTILENRNSV